MRVRDPRWTPIFGLAKIVFVKAPLLGAAFGLGNYFIHTPHVRPFVFSFEGAFEAMGTSAATVTSWMFVFTAIFVYRTLRPSIHVPPGHRALRIVRWVYSEKTVNVVFLQTIRDMQYEHLEALAHGQHWKARWVLVRGRWSVLSAALTLAPFSLLKRIVALWKAAS